jgi:AAA+ superfamily predicted ATPase
MVDSGMTAADRISTKVPVQTPAEIPFLARVRLRARRRALWLRALWSADENERALAITENEVARILTDPAEMADAELAFYRSNAAARELTHLIEQADRELATCERWCALKRVFGLTEEEADLLTLAAAVVADPHFGRVCAYLQDDATATFASPLLAAGIFGWPRGARISAASALARWRLASAGENAASLAPGAAWVADGQIVHWLLGERADRISGPGVERISPAAAAQECLYPQTLRAMETFLGAIRKTGPAAIELDLIGPAGAGKRSLALQLCDKLHRDMLVVDCEALLTRELTRPQTIERIFQAVRAARLENAVVYWNRADVLDAAARDAIAGLTDLVIFGSDAAGRRSPSTNVARQTYRLAALQQIQQRRLWQTFTVEPMPEEIAEWNLRPAELLAAAQVAAAGRETVLAECRRLLHQNGELVTTLKCPYTWDDIILNVTLRKQLEELWAQARLRGEVLENWGFSRLCPMGRGISVVFAGPSGTGKTMAAQVLARELGRELCRVDLAEVMNKYIGETEKRLKRVFDACERSAVVLFFDEADALFGQRTQAKDSHDRYANIQIDYLLQRMEEFDGIAILATNRKNDLDSAFLRRLRFIVDFQPPGPQERLQMWRRALPEKSPAGEDLLEEIDWNWLADVLVLTGADIKASALAAAFLARAEGSRIRMEHLVHATRREMAKQNAAWRAGDWNKKR